MSESKDTPPQPSGHRDAQETISRAEPPLTEVLADPLVHFLLERDGVPLATLRSLIGETRKRLGATRRLRTERRQFAVVDESNDDTERKKHPRRRRDDLT